MAKAAREAGLKVALSGLGGDELLAGYPSFRDVPRWSRLMRPPSHVPGLGVGLRLVGQTLGLAKSAPKALGMLEYGGDYAGAYLLRRGLFLPFELSAVLGADVAREGPEATAAPEPPAIHPFADARGAGFTRVRAGIGQLSAQSVVAGC